MNNVIAYFAPKKRRWNIAWDLIIGSLVWWGSPSSDSKHIVNKCLLWWRYKQRQPLNISSKQKHSTPIRTSRTINDTISSDWETSTSRQWSNNKYTITCLQGDVGWTVVNGYILKQVSSPLNRHTKSQWTINQEKGNRSGAGVAPSSTHGLLQRIDLWDLQLERPKNRPWWWRYEAKKAAEDAAAEEESKCLAAEATGGGEKSDEGASAGNVV